MICSPVQFYFLQQLILARYAIQMASHQQKQRIFVLHQRLMIGWLDALMVLPPA